MAMLRIFCLIVAVSFSFVRAHVTCPDDWTQHGFSCYYLRSCDVTWDDAERECLALGSHLVSVDSKAEQSFLNNYIAGENGPFWIGLNDKFREGQWFFTDMRRLRPELHDLWAPNEPSNNNADDDCVMWPHSQEKKWNDVKCTSKRSFVCEIELTGCPQGWTDHGDSCYRKFDSPKESHSDAQVHCQTIHPDCSLVKIDDHDEQRFVEDFLGDSCSDWIGLIGELDGASAQHSGSQEALPRDWYFTDGQPMVHDFWKADEPNFNKNDNRVCTMQKNNLGWNDYQCTKEQSYVCELKKPNF